MYLLKIKVEQAITITSSTKLSDEEIEKKVKEAEMNAEADKAKQEEIQVRNDADSIIYTAEKTLEDLKDQVSDDDKTKIEGLVKDLREVVAGDDIAQIKEKTEALTKAVQEIGAKIYQQAEAAQQQAAGAQEQSQGAEQAPNDDDDTIDADYKVKDE